MKVIEKISLVIFSYLALILSLIFCLLLLNLTNVQAVTTILDKILTNQMFSNIGLVISIIFILLSIKCIFFAGGSKEDLGEGILLENESGKLLISKDTIENLVNNVTSGFESVQTVNTKVEFDENNNVKIYLTLLVAPNSVIRELSSNLQIRIKEVVKKATDLDVQAINIRIKNIQEKQQEAE